MFPEPILKALEGIWHEIESQTLTPLFMAEPQAGLARTFGLVYPRFAAYYWGATLTLIGSLERPQLVGELVGYGFDALRDTLRERGRERLGREPLVAALIGLQTIRRVFKAASEQPADQPAQREQLEAISAKFTTSTTAYMLTMFAVSYALAQGAEFGGRWQNVSLLALWSQVYAAQLYDLARWHGLLRTAPQPPGQLPVHATEEELQLANAGLEEFSQFLEGLDRD